MVKMWKYIVRKSLALGIMLLSLEDSSAIHWNHWWDFDHCKALLRNNILLVLDGSPISNILVKAILASWLNCFFLKHMLEILVTLWAARTFTNHQWGLFHGSSITLSFWKSLWRAERFLTSMDYFMYLQCCWFSESLVTHSAAEGFLIYAP